MSQKMAVALPEKLTEKVKQIQKDLNLKTPGEVILRALSLLELSMGRKVELKDDENSYEINSFENFRQSVKIEEKDIADKK